MKIYSRFDRPDAKSVDFSGDDGVSKTQQHFKKECDINSILKSFDRTGILSHVNNKTPLYGDYSEVPDYLTANMIVEESKRKFASLPAFIRERFDNDPAKLVQFVEDDSNYDEAVKLGIIAGKGDKGKPDTVVVPPVSSDKQENV